MKAIPAVVPSLSQLDGIGVFFESSEVMHITLRGNFSWVRNSFNFSTPDSPFLYLILST